MRDREERLTHAWLKRNMISDLELTPLVRLWSAAVLSSRAGASEVSPA